MQFLPSILILLLLSGCGGFRGGIESVAYVGETAPQVERSHPSWPQAITLPGFTLYLSLNNAVRTYQYEVMLYIIPTYFNFAEEFRNREAGSLELTLQLAARDLPVTFDPQLLLLTVEGRAVRPSGVWTNNLEQERRAFDAYVKARRQSPTNQSLPLPRATVWREAVTDAVMIRPGEKSPRLIVTFPLSLLSPEKHLMLNLNSSIVGSAPGTLPLIHFKPMPWSEGYS
ncbi:MAG: hypothetical protein ACT4O4_05190 [Nitrospiraceae bacterium]